MRIGILLLASAMTVTGCAGPRAIIRPSTAGHGSCLNGDCRRSVSPRPSPQASNHRTEPARPKSRRVPRTERLSTQLPAALPEQAFGYVSPSPAVPGRADPSSAKPILVASNESPQAGPLDQMRGSVYPETAVVSGSPARVKIVLEPFVAPPIIDIDAIRMAMRGSVNID